MRRIFTILSILVLLLSLCACGGGGEQPSAGTAPEEAPAEEPAAAETAAPESVGQTVALGETIALDFVEMTFSQAGIVSKLEAKDASSGLGISMSPPEGKQYFCLAGTIKNTGAAEYPVTQLVGEVTFDGTYTYSVSPKLVEGGTLDAKTLSPLSENTYYLYAIIPDELASSFATYTLRIGFEDNFGAPAQSLDESAHIYCFQGERDAAAESAEPVSEETELSVGGSIALDFVEMTLEESGPREKIEFSSRASGIKMTSNRATTSDKLFLCIQGTFKNLGKEAVLPRFAGAMEIDGYSYDLGLFMVNDNAASVSRPAPLESVTYVLFAEVPKELAESYTSCVMRFGFDEGFSNDAFTQLESCAYQYRVDLGSAAQ